MDFTPHAYDIQIDEYVAAETVHSFRGAMRSGFPQPPETTVRFTLDIGSIADLQHARTLYAITPHVTHTHSLDVNETRYFFVLEQIERESYQLRTSFVGRVIQRALVASQIPPVGYTGAGQLPVLETVVRGIDAGGTLTGPPIWVGADWAVGTPWGPTTQLQGGTMSGTTVTPPKTKKETFHAPWGQIKRALHV